MGTDGCSSLSLRHPFSLGQIHLNLSLGKWNRRDTSQPAGARLLHGNPRLGRGRARAAEGSNGDVIIFTTGKGHWLQQRG